MSVYTSVSDDEMRELLHRHYQIGEFESLQGIAQGITNSNFFLHTNQNTYVLTVFESLTQTQLPFYLALTQHLSANNVACPAPIAQKNGQLDTRVADKPACIVSKLSGCDTASPTVQQCFSTGAMLAKMHLVGATFPQKMDNPRHVAWWTESVAKLQPFLDEKDAQLLNQEIDFLAKNPDSHLPSGIIHADLFKDNVLLDGNQLSGFIDFYYACNGSFVYDLAIAINDWARQHNNTLNLELKQSFIDGYQSIRPLTSDELAYLNTAHRAGCVRFWVSRLLDFHFPATGELTFIKDPNVFRDLLLTFH